MKPTKEMIEAGARAGDVPDYKAEEIITAALAAMPVPAVRLETAVPETHLIGWAKVPDEPALEFLKSINADNQVLAYENGCYYNAWLEFDPSEGGWFWTDDADSEPNPTHYRLLSEVALSSEGLG